MRESLSGGDLEFPADERQEYNNPFQNPANYSSIEMTISFGLWQAKHKSRWARVLAFLEAINAIKFK